MTRTERLFALLAALRARRTPISAAALGTRLGVSERTVYRDIATLNAQGAQIDGAAGWGYVLVDGTFLPPMQFDGNEVGAILFGLRFVERMAGDELAAAAISARAKLAAVAPQRFDDIAAMANPLLIGPRRGIDDRVWREVWYAISGNRELVIKYRDKQSVVSFRRVWPVALGWMGDSEVLAAWCTLRRGFRHFRLDRIDRALCSVRTPPTARQRLLTAYRATEPDIQI